MSRTQLDSRLQRIFIDGGRTRRFVTRKSASGQHCRLCILHYGSGRATLSRTHAWEKSSSDYLGRATVLLHLRDKFLSCRGEEAWVSVIEEAIISIGW